MRIKLVGSSNNLGNRLKINNLNTIFIAFFKLFFLSYKTLSIKKIKIMIPKTIRSKFYYLKYVLKLKLD